MSWKAVALGDVCVITGGGTPSKSNPDFYIGDIPWATVRDMNNDYIIDTDFKISKEAVKASSTNVIPKNNVIIASRVGLGKVCIIKQDTAINQDLRGVIPKDEKALDVNYLFYWFKSISKVIIDAGRGATVHGVTLPFIKSLRIPLPSLATQLKIVEKLDAIFAEIERATVATEANVKNAESLFQSYLTEVFELGGEGWLKSTLDKVCKVERGSSPRPIKDYFTESEDGVNWIKIGDTEEGGKYIFSTNQKITKAGAEKSRYVEVGDFILTNSMSYGRPYIMRTCGYVHDGWFVLRLNGDVDSEYFYYLLTSPYVQKQFQSLAAGSVVKNISGDLVKKTILPMPTLEKQKELAEIFTEKQIILKKLSETYSEKLKEIVALRHSILKQAFNGELVKE